MVDWRANRLVDAFAKTGAAIAAPSDETTALVKSAEALVKHRLAQLAQATHRANNHSVTVLSAECEWTTKLLRDSVSRPIGTKRSIASRGSAKKVATSRRRIENVKPWKAPPKKSRGSTTRAIRGANRIAAAEQLSAALKSRATNLAPESGKTATLRFHALPDRVGKKRCIPQAPPEHTSDVDQAKANATDAQILFTELVGLCADGPSIFEFNARPEAYALP